MDEQANLRQVLRRYPSWQALQPAELRFSITPSGDAWRQRFFALVEIGCLTGVLPASLPGEYKEWFADTLGLGHRRVAYLPLVQLHIMRADGRNYLGQVEVDAWAFYSEVLQITSELEGSSEPQLFLGSLRDTPLFSREVPWESLESAVSAGPPDWNSRADYRDLKTLTAIEGAIIVLERIADLVELAGFADSAPLFRDGLEEYCREFLGDGRALDRLRRFCIVWGQAAYKQGDDSLGSRIGEWVDAVNQLRSQEGQFRRELFQVLGLSDEEALGTARGSGVASVMAEVENDPAGRRRPARQPRHRRAVAREAAAAEAPGEAVEAEAPAASEEEAEPAEEAQAAEEAAEPAEEAQAAEGPTVADRDSDEDEDQQESERTDEP